VGGGRLRFADAHSGGGGSATAEGAPFAWLKITQLALKVGAPRLALDESKGWLLGVATATATHGFCLGGTVPYSGQPGVIGTRPLAHQPLALSPGCDGCAVCSAPGVADRFDEGGADRGGPRQAITRLAPFCITLPMAIQAAQRCALVCWPY
jgi:hypothetical protein